MRVGWLAAVAAAAALTASSCSSGASCGSATTAVADCAAQLKFRGHLYAEVDIGQRVPRGEELGDGSYPACSESQACGETDLGGFAATDVWRLDGVDPRTAVVGLRSGTHTYVVFARLGTGGGDVGRLIDGASDGVD